MVRIIACAGISENTRLLPPGHDQGKPRGSYHVNADIHFDHEWSCGPFHSRTDASRQTLPLTTSMTVSTYQTL